MTTPFRFAFASTLALALAACGGGDEATSGEAPSGEPIAAIPAPEGQSWVEVASETDEGGVVIGNPDAPLKLVEYASHTCGACANFSANGVPPLEADYVSTGIVSYEIRNLVRDPLDLTIATLARCGSPEGFHPLANQAWANLGQFFETAQANGGAIEAATQAPIEQRFVGIAEAAGLLDFFAARGISRDQARECLADPDAAQAILDRSQEQAEAMEITATPTFFLNGTRLDANQWDGIEPALQRAGAR